MFLGGSYTRGNGPANGRLSLSLDDGLVTLDLLKASIFRICTLAVRKLKQNLQ